MKKEKKANVDSLGSGLILLESGMAERAAAWGLVVKTDVGTGNPQGVGVRTSDEEVQGQN